MPSPDILHIAVPGKPRREGSAALNIPGTGTQFLDSSPPIIEVSLSSISGELDDRFNFDQYVTIDNQPIGVTGTINIDDLGGISTVIKGGESKLAVADLSAKDFNRQFLIQLQILNTHLAIMTEQEINEYDIISQE